MIVVFETPSVWRAVAVLGALRRASAVYFHRQSFPASNYLRPNARWLRLRLAAVTRLIRAVSPRAEIRQVPQQLTNRHGWPANRASLDVIDHLAEGIERSCGYRIVRSVVGTAEVLKYYKHNLARGHISAPLTFYAVGRELLTSEGPGVLVPRDPDEFGVARASFPGGLAEVVPLAVRVGNAVSRLIRRALHGAVLLAFPVLYLLREARRRGVALRRPQPIRGDVLMKVVWGFHPEGLKQGVLVKIDDGFLYNPELGLTDIVYVFHRRRKWGYGDEIKGWMRERGLAFVDDEEYRVTVPTVGQAFRMQLAILRQAASWPRVLADPAAVTRASYHALYAVLKKRLELQHVEHRVEFCRSDAASDHIIRTIVNRQHGVRTVGAHHTASPYDMPHLAHVHYDRYLVWGELFEDLYVPYWAGLRLERVSRLTIDSVMRVRQDPARVAEVRRRLAEAYPPHRYLAVLALPGDAAQFEREQWDELYEGLRDLHHVDVPFLLVMRLRESRLPEQLANFRRFTELANEDGRIVLDNVRFTIFELAAVCDLFIGANASFSLHEALAGPGRVFSFSFHGRAKHVFRPFGADFVLETRSDVVKVFQALEAGFAGYDCDWDGLRRKCNYHYDDRNLERIQRAVRATLDETAVATQPRTS